MSKHGRRAAVDGGNATQPDGVLPSVTYCKDCQRWTETDDKAINPSGELATVGVCGYDHTRTTGINGCAEGVPKRE